MTMQAKIKLAARVLASEHGAQKVILFGSRARGDAHERSDVDLLVIRPVHGPRLALEQRMLAAVSRLGLPADLVLLTPKEFERQQGLPGTLPRIARREGRVLYAAA